MSSVFAFWAVIEILTILNSWELEWSEIKKREIVIR